MEVREGFLKMSLFKLKPEGWKMEGPGRENSMFYFIFSCSFYHIFLHSRNNIEIVSSSGFFIDSYCHIFYPFPASPHSKR